MSSEIRAALGEAANYDHRSVASLLDKIITDYLASKGYLDAPESAREMRRFHRKQLKVPARIAVHVGSGNGRFPIVVLDISMGGVLMTYPRNSKIQLSTVGHLPKFGLFLEGLHTDSEVRLDCEARHIHDTGEEIKVGAAFIEPKKDGLVILNEYLN